MVYSQRICVCWLKKALLGQMLLLAPQLGVSNAICPGLRQALEQEVFASLEYELQAVFGPELAQSLPFQRHLQIRLRMDVICSRQLRSLCMYGHRMEMRPISSVG